MDVSRVMVAFSKDENVATTAKLAHVLNKPYHKR